MALGEKKVSVGTWKFCRFEKKIVSFKKMLVGEFPLPRTDMSGMSGIPWNARPKNGRGGGKTPYRAYRGEKKEKNSSSGKTKFFVGWKNKMLVGKKNGGWKKNVGWRNSPAKNGHVRNPL